MTRRDTNQRRPEAPRNRINGKFETVSIVTIEKRTKAEKRKTNQVRKELVNKQIFDAFIQTFFLFGRELDWIPVSCNSGPLSDLANRLFKPTFLLGHEERSRKLRLTVAGGDPRHLKPVGEFLRFATQDPTVRKGTPSKVRVFIGRRLPLKENYSSEIEPVRQWAIENFARGFLQTSSSEEAFSICLDVIKSDVIVDRRRAHYGYPKTPLARLTLKESNNQPSSHVDGSSGTMNEPDTYSQLQDQTNENLDVAIEKSGQFSQENEGTAAEQQDSSVTELQSNPFLKAVDAAYQVSCDEDSFCILSLLFDERIKNRLEMAAGAFLDRDRRGANKLDCVTKDVLLYAHWEAFGIKDREAHERRLEGLRTVLHVATQTRRARGLNSYSKLRSKYM